MKNTLKRLVIGATALTATVFACEESFLDRPPLGAISETAIQNEAGVNGSLIQAYRSLSGTNIANWYTSAMNWLWGTIRSEEAYKGSEASDQAAEINPVESFNVLPNSPSVSNKWRACYDGVGMANIVLRQLAATKGMSADAAKRIEAEAKFIRGYHHFEAKRLWNNVPFVDEKVLSTADYKALTNTADIYPQIEADLKFAYDNLPSVQSQKGRVNKWAAGAFLAKAYLYQKKYAEAKTLFDQIIASGQTNSGEKYGLIDRYSNVFKGDYEHSKEMVFGIEYTVGDGTGGANSNKDAELTNPHNDGPAGCCGFFQPSQSFANAFRTDNGLPMLTTYNDMDVKQHENAPTSYPDKGSLDPRLDWSVGRVGVAYKDWGLAKSSWIRNLANGGPFLPNKNVHWKDEVGKYFISGGWGEGQLGKNQIVMRFADVLLMAAECEVEVGDLNKARDYVNMVRKRAANPDDFVKGEDGKPAAAYSIATYSGAWTDKAVAREAVRFERKLELGMEGHRFFDLVRWGVAGPTINSFIAKESKVRTYLTGVTYKERDAYLPIPEFVINQSKTSDGNQGIKQNPGY